MIRFCQVLKTKIFDAKTFRVFWSKRGRWCVSSRAGSLPGADRGYVETTGSTVSEALSKMDDLLQARKDDLMKKINEIDQALFDIRTLGHETEELEK